MNQWIALYLSGQYPKHYRLPDRLAFIRTVRQKDPSNFSDTVIRLIADKNDVEFFNSILGEFENLHSASEYRSLLEDLGVPGDVLGPIKRQGEIYDVLDIDGIRRYFDVASEEAFSENIVHPLLRAMGYEQVEYKGRVHQTDHGADFYPVRFVSPGGNTHYAAVQVKAAHMSDGTTARGELDKLIKELKRAFGQPHRLKTGEEVRVSEALVFNSYQADQTAIDALFNDEELQNRHIHYFSGSDVITLLQTLPLDRATINNLIQKT